MTVFENAKLECDFIDEKIKDLERQIEELKIKKKVTQENARKFARSFVDHGFVG